MPWDHSTFMIRCLPIDGQPSTIELADQPVIVGSSTEAGFHVASRMVSRRHFQISRRDQDVYVTDFNSRNGTFLNGQRLQSNQETVWRPGDVLRIPDVEFELSIPAAFVPKPKGDFHLSASPSTVKAPSTVKLTLLYHGISEQHVTFQAYFLTPGFEVGMTPNGGTVRADTPFLSEAHIQKVKPFWRGGQFRVRFAANAMSGLLDTAEVTIKVRPRYELLLLLLLFLPVLAVMASPPSSGTIASVPTSTLRTEEPTLPIRVTPSQTPIPTATLPPTLTPITVTPPICANQCAAYNWPNYVIQAGDTLYSLAQGANISMSLVQQVNCLADPNQMTVGNTICLPVVPVVTTIPPSPTCAGFKATSPDAFPQGSAVFYWDAPVQFIPTSYRLDIYNADTGAWMTGQDIIGATTTTADVSWKTRGRYEKALWQIQALVNGVAVCSDAWVVPIEWPTPDDPQPTVVDLVVSSITATGAWDVESQCTDFAVDVQYTLTNRGNQSSGTFASNSYYGADSEVFAAQCGLFNATICPETALGGGLSTTFSHTQQMSFDEGHPAAIDVFARADVEGYGSASNQCQNTAYCNVAESNETNNQSATVSVPVPPCPGLPDLVISRIEPDYSRAECVIGVSFTAPVMVLALIGPAYYTRVQAQEFFNYRVPIQVTVQNQGDTDAVAGIPVEIETVPFEGSWAVEDTRTTTVLLAPGNEETLEGFIILGEQSLKQGRAIVNRAGNSIEESNLTNNTSAIIDLQLVDPPSCGDPVPPPDLIVDITNGPTAGCDGGCFIALDFLVTNIGGSDANTAFDIVVEINEGQVARFTLDRLSAGIDHSYSETIQADDVCVNPGCAVTVRVDADDTVTESNEDNNTASDSTAPLPPPEINLARPEPIKAVPVPVAPDPLKIDDNPEPILPETTVPVMEPLSPVIETLPDEATLTPETTAEIVETAPANDVPADSKSVNYELTATPPLVIPTDAPVDPASS